MMLQIRRVVNKIPIVVWVILLTIPCFYLIIRPGFFPMQDDLQAFRLQQMDKCFADLQIPCRWIPDMGYQYGYPQFEFYSPSVFYLGELLHLIGLQFIDSIKILFVLGFLLAAGFMYLLLRDLLNKWSAVVGAVLYTYTPFRPTQVYVRGALNEFWALAFFPLLLWSSYQLIKQRQASYGIWLGLSLAGLLLTHNLMSMVFLPVWLVWVVTWWYLESNKKHNLIQLSLSCLIGLGLSAFFILPLALEKSLVHIESLVGGYFDYRQHFVDLYQLFISNHFGYGSSVLGPNDDLSLSTGIIQWVVALGGVVLAFLSRRKHSKLFILTSVMAAVEIIVLFMMHQKSSLIWSLIPGLVWLQFPWRLLGVSICLLAILSAVAIYLLPSKYQAVVGVGIMVIAISMNVSFFRPKEWLQISDHDKFSGASWEKQLTISIFDYLPIYAKFPPNKKAPERPEILSGDAKFLSYRKGSNFQEGKVEVSYGATLRLPLFDFPGMITTLNGQVVAHRHDLCQNEDYCFGLISLSVPQGRFDLRANLANTLPRTIGNTITVLTFLGVIGWTAVLWRKR